MIEAIPPLPNTPSWRGADLKHRDNFTFSFYLKIRDHVSHSYKKNPKINYTCICVYKYLFIFSFLEVLWGTEGY